MSVFIRSAARSNSRFFVSDLIVLFVMV